MIVCLDKSGQVFKNLVFKDLAALVYFCKNHDIPFKNNKIIFDRIYLLKEVELYPYDLYTGIEAQNDTEFLNEFNDD